MELLNSRKELQTHFQARIHHNRDGSAIFIRGHVCDTAGSRVALEPERLRHQLCEHAWIDKTLLFP